MGISGEMRLTLICSTFYFHSVSNLPSALSDK